MSTSTSFDPRIVLRPRTLDETYDLAIAYLRVSGRDFWRIFLVPSLFVMAVLLGCRLGLSMGWGACCSVLLVVMPVTERMVTVFAGRHLFNNPTSTRSAIAAVLKKLPQTLVFGGIVSLPWIMMLATEFDNAGLVGLGAMLGTMWPLILASHVHLGEVIHLEQLSTWQSARRARALVAYRFARALGMLTFGFTVRLLFVVVVYGTVSFLAEFMLQVQGAADLLGPWAALGGYVLAGPYIALVRLFDYVDARTQREGWDIQVRFNAVAQRARKEEAQRHAA